MGGFAGKALGAALALLTACSLAYPLGDAYTRGEPDGGSSNPEAGPNPEAGAEAGLPDPTVDPPMMVYATSNGQTHIRRYDAAAHTWSAPTDGPTTVDPIRYVELRRSPVDGSRVLAIYSCNNIAEPRVGLLEVFDWTSAGFIKAWSSNDFGGRPGYHPFDLAFMRKSGRAVVVYGGGSTGTPKIRMREGSWSTEQLAFPKAPIDDWFDYFELAGRDGSDDLAFLYQSNTVQIGAARLVGSSFSDPTILTDKGLSDINRSVSGAFEQTSGDFVAVWGSKEGGVDYFVAPAGSGKLSGTFGNIDNLGGAGRVVAAAQPRSDRVAFSVLEYSCGGQNCDDYTTVMWNGASFDPYAVIDGDVTTPYSDLITSAPTTVAWNGDDALALWHRSATGFNWGRWRSGAWTAEVAYTPAVPIPDKASFVPFHAGRDLVVLVQDRTGGLWAARYDGNAWVDTTNGVPLTKDLADPTLEDGMGVHFSVDAP